jgi:hypothetical protein
VTHGANDNDTLRPGLRVSFCGDRSLVVTGEDVFQEEPESCWRFLFGEDLAHRCEDVIDSMQTEYLQELPDVFRLKMASTSRVALRESYARAIAAPPKT